MKNNLEKELECLRELRKFLQGDERLRELEKEVLDSRFLLHFVRGKKCNAAKAFVALKGYCETRMNGGDPAVSHVNPEKAKVIRTRDLGVLRRRDREGRAVIYWRFDEPEGPVGVDDVVEGATLLAEEIWNEEAVERKGFLLVIDHRNLEWRQIVKCTPFAVKRLVNLFSRDYPLRYSGLWIVNAERWVSWVLRAVVPFLPYKLRSRLQVLRKEESWKLWERLGVTEESQLPRSLRGNCEDARGGEKGVWDEALERRLLLKKSHYGNLRRVFERVGNKNIKY